MVQLLMKPTGLISWYKLRNKTCFSGTRSPIREDPDERREQEEKYFFLRLRSNLRKNKVPDADIMKFFLEWFIIFMLERSKPYHSIIINEMVLG